MHAEGGPDVKDLALRLQAGDHDALRAMFARWGSLVQATAARSVGNFHDAEEVTQQVFVSAWRSRHTLDPAQGSPLPWLIGITRRRCADLHSSRARLPIPAGSVMLEPTVRQPADDEARLVLSALVDELDEPRRTIVRMAFYRDQTHQVIASSLGLPLGTVKSHVRRGLLQLRAAMKEVHYDPS